MDRANYTQKYSLLKNSLQDDQEESDSKTEPYSQRSFSYRLLRLTFGALAFLSILANIVFLVLLNRSSIPHTKFANLIYDVPTPIYSSTQYGPGIGTEEDRDRHWNALDISPGIIAIPDTEAELMGLPPSQRLPWDQSTGVYLLGAHHQIHCLKSMYQYISNLHNNRTTLADHAHILHCLDDLLQDAYCHADDLPWMQLPPQPDRKKYPKYQVRQCKSWKKLLSWADKYNSCYKYDNVTDASGMPTKNDLEHYKFCPEGSKQKAAMEACFRNKEASALDV